MAMKFTETEGDAWGRFLSVHAAMMRRLDDMLQTTHRISHGEFEVLLRLSWAPDNRMRLRDLADASVLTRSGISRLVDRLVQAEFVARETASEDGRGAYAVLTREGKRRLKVAERDNIALVREHFLSLYSEEELRQMGGFWQRFLDTDRSASPPHSTPRVV